MQKVNIGHVSEPPEPPPKTYTVKDKFEYFKPCVQVEMDHPEKFETINEVFVRGKCCFCTVLFLHSWSMFVVQGKSLFGYVISIYHLSLSVLAPVPRPNVFFSNLNLIFFPYCMEYFHFLSLYTFHFQVGVSIQ